VVALCLPWEAARAWERLDGFVAEALNSHPRIAEAQARAEAARYGYEEAYGFFDPGLTLSGGWSDEARALPGTTAIDAPANDAAEVGASLDVPVRPGFYFSIGAVSRRYAGEAGYDPLYQSLFGVGVRIPLLHDRGFRLWDLDRLRLLADYDRALSGCLAERQQLRHEVELAVVNLCESAALCGITRQATGRAETLLADTRNLVEHQAIAEYQVLPAQMEVDLGKADELAAQQAFEVARYRLQELLAGREVPGVEEIGSDWVAAAARLELRRGLDVASCCRDRGGYLELLHERLRTELSVRYETEQRRGDLSLSLAGTLQGEDGDWPLVAHNHLSAQTAGGHVMLVYRRTLGWRAENSRIGQHESRIREIGAGLQRFELELSRELLGSTARFDLARQQFEQASRAAESARRSLDAEKERFQLGESRSRDVLDAQNDFTRAVRQQTAAAAGVLRAWADHRFAAGYPEDPVIHDGMVPAGNRARP